LTFPTRFPTIISVKPIVIKGNGVSVRIRKVEKKKAGKVYESYVVDYRYLKDGQRVRKQEWKSDLETAKQVARDACSMVASGEVQTIELKNGARMEYVRATEVLAELGLPIDDACREYADAVMVLNGRASVLEVARDWMKRNDIQRPKVLASVAVEEIIQQETNDGKSQLRIKQLKTLLGRFSKDLDVEVHAITPDLVSRWLAGLALSERTRRNFRDTVGFFCRFCVRRGYLAKGTDWLEGVQEYTARKTGEILIYTPDEIMTLLNKADKRLVPFLAIGAFAGLRHAEIARLDWSEIELVDAAGDSFIEVRADKAKTLTRRLVPVKNNLKAWLLPHRKTAGKVCPFENTTKQLLKTAAATGDAANEIKPLEWKKNALRHSYISYRIAECGNVPLVADESGNSVTVIRTNYLRRVKPAIAAKWFNIMPAIFK
jgi:integrase